jgi:predicted aconitase
MLEGQEGPAVQRAIEIVVALAKIYQAPRLVPVSSVQVAGVSYKNLGDAGLEFLSEWAAQGARVRVPTTLNPAGLDLERWRSLGFSERFARQQQAVINAYVAMGVSPTCTCTPYLIGNRPGYAEHIAWAESSAVSFANSVLGARTNREGGPSALAAALTGVTPAYGYHLTVNRQPGVTVKVQGTLTENSHFGALGKTLGERLQEGGGIRVPYLRGVRQASVENLKSFCASVATYGGVALFHMEGVTPEAAQVTPPGELIVITEGEIEGALDSLTDAASEEVDFVSLGCPHLTIQEIARIAELLKGKRVTKEFWITTARPTKQIADRMGYTAIIEASGAKFAADTCCVVAPIQGRFKALATDSAKACYYAYAKNKFKTVLKPFDEVVMEAVA